MMDLNASAELDIPTNWHFFRSLFFRKTGKPTQAGVPARQTLHRLANNCAIEKEGFLSRRIEFGILNFLSGNDQFIVPDISGRMNLREVFPGMVWQKQILPNF